MKLEISLDTALFWVFILFAALLFWKAQYWPVTFVLFGAIAVLKSDSLIKLAVRKDGFEASFTPPSQKIEEDIRQNDQVPDSSNFFRFRMIEAHILRLLQQRYGGEMKTQVHFVYGDVDKPQFRYTPDGSMNTTEALYLFEIKYILKPELTKSIVEKTLPYLTEVYTKLAPMAGKKLVIKLILASGYDLDVSAFQLPEGIEIECIKV